MNEKDESIATADTAEKKEKIVERELAKIADKGHREIALAVAHEHRTFAEILPAAARDNIKPFILSAIRYIRRNLAGEKFTKESFVDAVFDAAQYGLPIDGRLAYALPFADKAQGGVKNLVFVPDFKGIVAVAKQKGIVRDVRAYVVHEFDDFDPPGEDAEHGLSWSFKPKPRERGKVVGALCVLEFPDGFRVPEFMTEDELQKVRNSAKTKNVWDAWPDEMRKKSVIRRAFKVHQDDPVMSSLLASDDAAYGDEVIEVQPRTRELTLPDVGPATADDGRPIHPPTKPERPPVEERTETGRPVRRRGRPRGSKNKPKAPESGKERGQEPEDPYARTDARREPPGDGPDADYAKEMDALKGRFRAAWLVLENSGQKPQELFGVTDEEVDTLGPVDLADLVQMMEESVEEAKV